MDKRQIQRAILFVLSSFLILMVYHGWVAPALFPPPRPQAAKNDKQGQKEKNDKNADKQDNQKQREESESNDSAKDSAEPKTGDVSSGDSTDSNADADNPAPGENESPPKPHPQRWLTLGSLDSESPYRGLWTFSTRGAAVERMELCPQHGKQNYYDLEDKSGYFGHLALTDEVDGLTINVSGPGAPAHDAGLRAGDVIQRFNGNDVADRAGLSRLMQETEPGQKVKIRAVRDGKPRDFTVVLQRRPLEVIRPEPLGDVHAVEPEVLKEHSPLSCRFTLANINGTTLDEADAELLRTAQWRVGTDENGNELDGSDGKTIEFRLKLSETGIGDIGQKGDLEFVRRYEIAQKNTSTKSGAKSGDRAFHLAMTLEIHNLGQEEQRVVYKLEGPNGLPSEGWWYAYKVHKAWFTSAGARDIAFAKQGGDLALKSPAEIYSESKKGPRENLLLEVFGDEVADKDRQLAYAGVDALYFACMYLPFDAGDGEGDESRVDPASSFAWSDLKAKVVGDSGKEISGRARSKINTSFELTSISQKIAPGKSHQKKLVVFAGPKDPEVLADYRLSPIVYYGLFSAVSRPLLMILHGFYWLVGNYGLAIIMLTVLVRGCMFPLSRKVAKNAQMMQALAPEMKKLAEKHKNDLQKRGEAQRELFAKYKYNPLGGCWMMFLQLPIFLGLYRGLAVDLNLRDASLIPGISWCSNLAAPDMLAYWGDSFLPDFLVGVTGYLGPYFNLLPLITVALFLIQQKLFTPPATDEQTRLQMKMMNFMTLFIGILFFKVPAGLCIYFITSSLWGIAERKLLPKKSNPEDLLKQRERKTSPTSTVAKKPRPNPWDWANGVKNKKSNTQTVSKGKRQKQKRR